MNTILLGLVIISCIYVMNCDSKEGFIQASDNYFIPNEEQTFVGALLGCKSQGMELASVRNANEQEDLENVTSSFSTNDGFWIGGVSQSVGSDIWYWVESGLRIAYTNWGELQPRNYNNDYRRKQCIRLGNFNKYNEPYKWENVDCGLELFYVCKIV